MTIGENNPGFKDIFTFPLLDALLGRRSRRFFKGAEIPDGVFAYKSKLKPEPLSDLEKLIIVSACGTNTSYHHMIFRGERYAPNLSNYAGSAGGRTFPSAAGFHTSVTFFTDDSGVYYLDCRDTPSFTERMQDGSIDFKENLKIVESRIHKIQNERLQIPAKVPFIEPHNTWVANHAGTLLVIPIGDLAQHVLLGLCYMLQNGLVLYDDIHKRAIPGIEQYATIVDVNNVWPITYLEQWAMAELTTELSVSCYAGALMLQAMGIGGWMYNGIDFASVMGMNKELGVPGLGFRFDTNEKWPYPNPTGLSGVMEAFCPPHYPTMRDAVDTLCERKFGRGGPFHPETPGPWKDSKKVRSASKIHDTVFRECIALQAQYVYDTFGKFPGTVPSLFTMMYLQAHHLDLQFYDTFFKPGAYLKSHAHHDKKWHTEEK